MVEEIRRKGWVMIVATFSQMKGRSTALVIRCAMGLLVISAGLLAGCHSSNTGAAGQSSTNGVETTSATAKAPGNLKSGDFPEMSARAVSALDMARMHRNQGRHELATYYFLNAINADPGNAQVLLEYGKLVEEIAAGKDQEEKTSEAAELLERLASLFYGQALQVNYEAVEAVVTKAAEYQKWAEKMRQEEYASGGTGADYQEWETLKQKLINGEAPILPEAQEEAEEQSRELEPLLPVARRNASPGDEEAVQWLEDRLHALQAVLAFHRGKGIINEYLDHAKSESSPIVAAMILQQAELTFRELAALKALLPTGLANEVTDLTRQLNEAAVEASNRQAKESSQKAWEQVLKEKSIETRIAAITAWEPPQEVTDDGACTRQLEELETLMREIQAMIPLFSDFETREKAVDLLQELSKEAERISRARQNRYCRWALDRIKAALELFEKNRGWINDNEIAFGEALINELGPIDESLLTFETRRCYSEAFETIFGELGKIKSTDRQTKGTKMYVLKGMLEKGKNTYRDF